MCYQELLHDVQCCYMLPRVITCCNVVDVTKSYYMLSSVVACYLELLHAMSVATCYQDVMQDIIICCPVLLNFI